MAYRVVDGAGFEDEIQRLWRSHLEIAGDTSRRYRWLYGGGGSTEVHPLVLLSDNGCEERVVGATAILVRPFWSGGRSIRAGLHVDLVVEPGHRTLLPALRLVRAAQTIALREADVAYGFPNEASLPVFRRIGYQVLGRGVRRARVLRHGPYIERRVASQWASDIGGPVLDSARGALDMPRRLAAFAQYRLEWSGVPPADLDELWEGARDRWAVVGVRNAEAFRWRFVGEPGESVSFGVLRTRGAGREPRAVVVVRRANGVAYVRDWFGYPADLCGLLDLLVPSLRRQGARAVTFDAILPHENVKSLASRGFQRRERGDFLVATMRDDPTVVGLAQRGRALLLTDFDRDT